MQEVSPAAIERGFDKFEVFAQVQRGKPLHELTEAMVCFQESLGLDEEITTYLCKRISDGMLATELEDQGHILLGVLLGLSIAEFINE